MGTRLGDELRRMREMADMTQAQLAAKAGITREYVNILENGHQSPTVDIVFALCKALRVKPSNLIRRAE